MPFRETPIKKKYWQTSEVAQELHVPASQVRFWMDYFCIPVHRSKRRGDRRFTEENKNQLREIYYLLKVEGLRLWGAKKRLEGL